MVNRQIRQTKVLRDDIEGFVHAYANVKPCPNASSRLRVLTFAVVLMLTTHIGVQENKEIERDTMEINADLCMPMTDLESRPIVSRDVIEPRP
eukprot:2696460-Rhodomonas_salina.1